MWSNWKLLKTLFPKTEHNSSLLLHHENCTKIHYFLKYFTYCSHLENNPLSPTVVYQVCINIISMYELMWLYRCMINVLAVGNVGIILYYWFKYNSDRSTHPMFDTACILWTIHFTPLEMLDLTTEPSGTSMNHNNYPCGECTALLQTKNYHTIMSWSCFSHDMEIYHVYSYVVICDWSIACGLVCCDNIASTVISWMM